MGMMFLGSYPGSPYFPALAHSVMLSSPRIDMLYNNPFKPAGIYASHRFRGKHHTKLQVIILFRRKVIKNGKWKIDFIISGVRLSKSATQNSEVKFVYFFFKILV